MLVVHNLKRDSFRIKSTLDRLARRCDIILINLDSTLVQRINSPDGLQRHKFEREMAHEENQLSKLVHILDVWCQHTNYDRYQITMRNGMHVYCCKSIVCRLDKVPCIRRKKTYLLVMRWRG